MSYSLNDIREKFNLAYDKANDKPYGGKNAHEGHYWANDNDGNKVYLGHNDNLSSLLNNSELEDASGSTKYDHDTDVARGLAGLLNHDPSKKIDKPKKKKEKLYEPPEPTPEYQQAKQSVAEYKKRLYSGDFLKGKSNGWWEDDDTTESDITTPIEPNVTEQNDTKKSFITKRHAEGFMKDFMEKFNSKYKIDLIADDKKRKADKLNEELA